MMEWYLFIILVTNLNNSIEMRGEPGFATQDECYQRVHEPRHFPEVRKAMEAVKPLLDEGETIIGHIDFCREEGAPV